MIQSSGVLTLFRWTPMVPKPGEVVTFSDDIGNIVKLDFGDGNFTMDALPVIHIYKKEGKYTVTAKSIGTWGEDQGKMGTQSQQITVSTITPPTPPTPPTPGYWARLIAALVAFLKSIIGK